MKLISFGMIIGLISYPSELILNVDCVSIRLKLPTFLLSRVLLVNLEGRALKETREIRFICFTTVQTMLGKHTATIIDMMTNFVLFY